MLSYVASLILDIKYLFSKSILDLEKPTLYFPESKFEERTEICLTLKQIFSSTFLKNFGHYCAKVLNCELVKLNAI